MEGQESREREKWPRGRCKWRRGVVTRALSVRQGTWSLDEEEIFKTDLAGEGCPDLTCV